MWISTLQIVQNGSRPDIKCPMRVVWRWGVTDTRSTVSQAYNSHWNQHNAHQHSVTSHHPGERTLQCACVIGCKHEAIAQECESFRWLSHTALSKLLDHFPLESSSSYVTVWETMESDTLAAYLLRNGPITEKEARGILLQILSALRFAQVKGHQMDCEDLKPSRLLFRGGEVRITSLLLPHAAKCPQLGPVAVHSCPRLPATQVWKPRRNTLWTTSRVPSARCDVVDVAYNCLLGGAQQPEPCSMLMVVIFWKTLCMTTCLRECRHEMYEYHFQ